MSEEAMTADQSDAGHGISSEELRRIDPINPGFIDALEEANRRENDAGRDGIDLNYERDRATRMMARQSGEDLPNIYMPIDQKMEAAYRARALASAPGETVGRGEELATDPAKVLPADTTTLPGAVGKKDPARKFKPRSAFDHIHALIKDGYTENARAVVEAEEFLIDEARALALPTADRDAIREALESMRAFINDWQLIHTTTNAKDELAKLTAALALLGEG